MNKADFFGWSLVAMALGACAALLIQVWKEPAKNEQPHFSAKTADRFIKKCYAADLYPVIVRDDKGNIIHLCCKEKTDE